MSQQLEQGQTKDNTVVGVSDTRRCQQRYIIGIICSIGAIITVIARDSTSTVIDYLVRPENISITEVSSQCPRGPGESVEEHFHGKFEWSEDTQKFILFSFYIGYIVTHVPVGMVSERYGVKWPFLGCVLASAIITALTPIAIEKGEQYGLIGMNILLGLSQGGLTPALAVVIVRWFPPSEHTLFGALLMSSSVLGNAIVQIMAYFILNDLNWIWVYYIIAGITVIYCVIFVIFFHNSPEKHPFITEKEKKLLTTSNLNVTSLAELPSVPWKSMLSSLPVWAYIVVHVGHDWVLYGMILKMPLYLHDVLRFSHVMVLSCSVVPVIVLFMTAIAWGFFSDYLLARGLMNVNDLRKMNTMIASFGSGLFLLFCSYARCHFVLAIIFFTMCMCVTGIFFSGAKLNSMDLCPNYAGTLMGISNGLGSVGAMAPSILHMMNEKNTLLEWRNVFWIDFVIIAIASIIYLLFGSSKIQKWNFP